MRDVACKGSWLIVALALTTAFSVQGATRPLGRLVGAVLRNGPESRLPAHLSVVLGVSGAQRETGVKQAVLRDGDTVRTFNVCLANHQDLVILEHNEKTQTTKAYLLTANGVLRKAIVYQAGGAARERPLAEAHRDFASEIKFWRDFADHQLQERTPR